MAHLVSQRQVSMAVHRMAVRQHSSSMTTDKDKPHAGAYKDLSEEVVLRMDADFAMVWVENGQAGTGFSVSQQWPVDTQDARAAHMKRIAKAFEFMAQWARREAGETSLH